MTFSPHHTPQILWKTSQKTLTLDGHPVLEYTLNYPEVTGCGLVGRFLRAYYRRMARAWETRWQREVYLRACLDYSRCQTSGTSFVPWQGSLHTELTLLEPPFLSLRFSGSETQGKRPPCRVSWGEVWNLSTGAPCHWKDFLDPPHTKSQLVRQITMQGTQQAAAGVRFFLPGWDQEIKRCLPSQEFWLTPEHLHLAFPQCSISPAVEGTPEFALPRKNRPESAL